MDIYLWSALEITLNFFDAAFVLLIMTFQLGLKSKTKNKRLVVFYLGLVLLQTVYDHLTANSASIIFVMIVFSFLYASIFLENHIIIKVFLIVFISGIMIASDMLAVSIVNVFYPGVPWERFLSANIYRFLAILLTKTLESILLIVLVKNKLHLDYQNKLNIFFNTCCLAVVLLVMGVLVLPQNFAADPTLNVVLGMAVVFINVQILFCFYLMFQSMNNKSLEKGLDEQTKKKIYFEAYVNMYHKTLQKQFDRIKNRDKDELK